MSRPRLLIVDDDRGFAAKLAGALEGLFHVETCHSEAEFHDQFAVGRYDLLIMDMRLKEHQEGLDLLKEALARDPMQAAIVMTAYADTETYADAIGSGALTYLDKREFSPALIARTIEAIVEQGVLRKRLAAAEQRLEASEPQEIIGISAGIKEVSEQLRRAAEDGEIPVLIVGEPGSGKELAARNIHRLSRRRAEGPFVHASCGRTHSGGVAASIFGAVQLTAGDRARDSKCRIDEARGGVLFVDGVAGLDASECLAFAQLIETGFFNRTGETARIEADAQVVVSVQGLIPEAAHLDEIRAAIVSRGGIEARIPPLRERQEDISLIAQYTLQCLYRLGRTQARSFRAAALTMLDAQPWPGNVRELKGAIEYAAVRADATGDREIGMEHLPQIDLQGPKIPNGSSTALDYQAHLARAELGLVELAIERFETTKKSALAERLRYNDRFIFSRRMRRTLTVYPGLQREFPKTAALFSDRKTGQQRLSVNSQ